MKKIYYACGYAVAIAFLTLALAPRPALAQQQSAAKAAAPGPGNAENGRKAFLAHGCFSCHGYQAEGGPGLRLVGYPDTLQSFAAYVRQPKGIMPSFGSNVSARDLTDIYTWVRSIPPSPDAKTIELLKP